ncbi:MAG: hypothetical protein Q9163_005947 [Psora crenata]
MSGHLGNLTMLGAIDQSEELLRNTRGKNNCSPNGEQHRTSFTPLWTCGKQNPLPAASIGAKGLGIPSARTAGSNGDRETSRHIGIPLNGSGANPPPETSRQTKSFAQIAREQGLRDWNSSAFDDRWLLRSGEMYTNSERNKTLTASHHQAAKGRTSSDYMDFSKTGPLPPYNETAFRDCQHPQHPSAQSDEIFQQQNTSSPSWVKKTVDDQSIGTKPNNDTTVSSGHMSEHGEEEVVPTPQEAERLKALVRDINAGKGPCGLPFSPRIIRRYFYERCFGNGEGPAVLDVDHAKRMTIHCDKPITVGALRSEILSSIEDLILYLMSPVGAGLLQNRENSEKPSSTYATQPEQSKVIDTAMNSSSFEVPLSKLRTATELPGSIVSHSKTTSEYVEGHGQAMQRGLFANLHTSGVASETTQHGQTLEDAKLLLDDKRAKDQDANLGPVHLRIQTTTVDPQTVGQARLLSEPCTASSNHQNGNFLSSLGRLKLSDSEEETLTNEMPWKLSQPYDNERSQYGMEQVTSQLHTSSNGTTQSGILSPEIAPWPPLRNSSGPTPLQSPQQPQHASHPAQQPFQHTYANQMTPAQLQYVAFQQMQRGGHQPTPAQWDRTNAQQLSSAFAAAAQPSGGCYPPNGVWVPNDRYVRPPAMNRIAPLFAQSGAWQTNQARQTPGSVQHPEWQNRFGSPTTIIPRDNRKLAYLEGSDDMFPQPPLGGGASVRFQNLSRTQPPSLNVVTEESNVPFVETARVSKPAQWGVMKIGNIPYDLTKASVITFLGNHAKIITPELGPAVHIIMDRATGKTQDCYVEFFSTPDANAWVNVINSRSNAANRIGDRVLEVQLSSQDELLKELFPRAKNIRWEGGNPVIVPSDDPYNSGFKSFVSAEELQILVRHAEQPHRSNYTLKCPNRPYEAMISLLIKFPWQATPHYTLSTRNKIFHATRQMLHLLCSNLWHSPTSRNPSLETSPINAFGPFSNYKPPPSVYNNAGVGCTVMPRTGGMKPLNAGLLRDLLSAALNAPGFSEKQRWELYHTADLANRSFSISPLAREWPFEVLGRKRGMEEDVVEWYAQLVGTHPMVQASGPGAPFGNLTAFFRNVDEGTMMEDAGELEWNVMVKILMDQCCR